MNYNQNLFFGQLWAARTVNNCDLVELPVSVTDLLFIGENRNFNFLESLKPLNIRKEAENCLPAAFQFWAKPQAKKLLDNQIYSLMFGGKWQLDNIIEDSCDEGMLRLLLTAVNIQKYFGDCPRFEASFSKENFVDSSYENFKKLPKGQQNISLLKEFEKLLSEFDCPSRYLLEIFNNEVKREDYCIEKRQYRSRKNILMIYRGMLFLTERRFEVFMNVVLFNVLHNVIKGEISEEMVACLIRAGMVLANVQVWITLVSSRDSDNINRTTKGIMLKTKMSKTKKSAKTTKTESKKGSSASEIIKKDIAPSKATNNRDAMQLLTSSDSEEFSSPAILASYSQFKSGKRKMDTVETNSSEHCFSNKI
jgi:hypothetical protein